MTFEFLADFQLRRTVESEYADLKRCVSVGAMGPALVLAAVIAERLIVDLLVQAEPDRYTTRSLDSVALPELIDRAIDHGLVPSRLRMWAVVLIDYRALLHRDPARRLTVDVSRPAADAAVLVVDTIATAAMSRYAEQVGLTPAALVDTLASGEPVAALLDSQGIDSGVLVQVLTETLPRLARQAVADHGVPSSQVDRIGEMVDLLFARLPDDRRVPVVETLIATLDRETERVGPAFEAAILRARTFQYAGEQRGAARAWLIRRFLSPIPPAVLARLHGVTVVLFPGDPGAVVDAIVQAAFLDADQRATLIDFFKQECAGLTADQSEAVMARIEAWFARVDTATGGDYVSILNQMMTLAAILQPPE